MVRRGGGEWTEEFEVVGFWVWKPGVDYGLGLVYVLARGHADWMGCCGLWTGGRVERHFFCICISFVGFVLG